MFAVDDVVVNSNSNRPTDHTDHRDSLVLVAEDDPIQRIALTKALERAGFAVIAAENGMSAIQLADTHRPDLMIVDAVMPGLSGFVAIAAIRERPGLATTPAIVVSGLEDVESRLNAFAIGADDFVTKPVDPAELIARVRAQLRIVDAWHGRVNDMITDLRSIRRQISGSRRATTPVEAARTMMQHFPAAIGCSTLVTLDDDGRADWASDPFYPEDVAGLDYAIVDSSSGSVTVDTNDRGQCSLCGVASGGSMILADAGSWTGGRAILAVGCIQRTAGELRVVAEEVADACGVVLTERLRNWESDLELSNWLESVIAGRAFDVHYQPIVDMRSGRVIAQEALVRFHDGTAPGQVFQAAATLDRRVVLELALVEAALEQAVALPDGVRVHVNVSPLTALAPELGDIVRQCDRRVVLEVCENALFTSDDAKVLRDAIPASCLLAADDVGVGYAGLSQLLEYRPDIVKIDRAVVTGIDRDPARQALVAGLVKFAEATDSCVIGEGVERAEEWQMLRQLGVELAQGFYLGRPAPLAEAARLSHCTTVDFRPLRPSRFRHLLGS